MYLKVEKGINLCTVTPTFKNYCLITNLCSSSITSHPIPNYLEINTKHDIISSFNFSVASLKRLELFLNRK